MLKSDGDLMKMFEVVKKKVIDIWIGELSHPSHVWELAM